MNKVPKIKILFENEYEIVIDKPAGIMSHPDGRKDEYTLSDWLKDYLKDKMKRKTLTGILKNVGEEGREGVVHRLDTGTTGVMIFAITYESFLFLKKQFQAHSIKKVYHAIVMGHIKNDTGIIDAAISRSKSDFRKKSVKDIFENDGKGNVGGIERDAVTRYKVLSRLKSKSGKPYTFVECYPETGRTHQIRVHLRSIRHPILGDELYGVGEKERDEVQKDFKTKLTRPMLHAHSLKIKVLTSPIYSKGVEKTQGPIIEEKTFTAKEHNDMKKVLEELGFE